MSLLQDGMYIIMTLFVFAIAAVAVGLVWQGFNSAISSDPEISQVAKTGVSNINSSWPSVMDWMFAALLFGLPIVSMGLAYFNQVPAIFFYVVIAVMFLMLFIGYGLQSGWEQIIATPGDFSTYVSANMPLTNFVMNNLGLYSILVIAIIGFGTYVKTGSGGGGVYA